MASSSAGYRGFHTAQCSCEVVEKQEELKQGCSRTTIKKSILVMPGLQEKHIRETTIIHSSFTCFKVCTFAGTEQRTRPNDEQSCSLPLIEIADACKSEHQGMNVTVPGHSEPVESVLICPQSTFCEA